MCMYMYMYQDNTCESNCQTGPSPRTWARAQARPMLEDQLKGRRRLEGHPHSPPSARCSRCLLRFVSTTQPACMCAWSCGVEVLDSLPIPQSGAKVHFSRGSIVAFRGDAIVNAANEQCQGGGGVDGAVAAAGGSGLAAARAALPIVDRKTGARCLTGDAVVTVGGELGVRWVVHAVGPNYHLCGADAPALLGADLDLYRAYAASMTLAARHSVAVLGVSLLRCLARRSRFACRRIPSAVPCSLLQMAPQCWRLPRPSPLTGGCAGHCAHGNPYELVPGAGGGLPRRIQRGRVRRALTGLGGSGSALVAQRVAGRLAGTGALACAQGPGGPGWQARLEGGAGGRVLWSVGF